MPKSKTSTTPSFKVAESQNGAATNILTAETDDAYYIKVIKGTTVPGGSKTTLLASSRGNLFGSFDDDSVAISVNVMKFPPRVTKTIAKPVAAKIEEPVDDGIFQ